MEVEPLLGATSLNGCSWNLCLFLKTRQAKSGTIAHYITLKNSFVIFIYLKNRRTSNLKKTAQSSEIAKFKSPFLPDFFITDDDETDSLMIDGTKYL